MIEAKNIHKKFKTLYAVKGIDLKVEDGEVLCIIGPSGSGKSTLLRCLNGLEQKDEGEIFVDGVEGNESNITQLRQKMTMVFQKIQLVYQNITTAHTNI